MATEDIKRGTILAVSKAFSAGYKKDSPCNLFVINMIRKVVDGAANALQVIRTIENLRKNPKRGDEFYKMYTDDLSLNAEISEGLLD
jgi:hypothetical protein